ncbi:hypothetical protein WJX81_003759 [Elliptochloris bilobata]|uniref:Late endosomal/lysosomal adaptor and MAPK and MTOR activator 5 n=1 Tax=Elliptochloris bilobata TaxID=381761 RepID=A0AAW1SJD6_9CHLO
MGANKPAAAPHWDTQLQHYLQQGVLSGYALIDAAGRCVCEAGVLCGELPTASASQLSAAFHALERAPERLQLCGQAAVVVRRTAADIYATLPHRRASVCVSNLPSGVLHGYACRAYAQGKWGEGATEGGSSGSMLMNADQDPVVLET